MSIKRPTKMRIYNPVSHFKFDTTAEPTIEAAGARNYATNAIIADGGQVINAMDGHPGRFLAVGGDLLTGDDSTFASDTGNWTGDTSIAIAGGKLVFTAADQDEKISITLPISLADYATSFTISDYTNGDVRINIGATEGTARSSADTFPETLTGGVGTTISFEARTSPTNLSISIATVRLADTFRIDLEANTRQSYNSLVLDGNNLLTSLPASMLRNLQAFYHTADTFGSATEITPSKVISGLLGQDAPYADLDGENDYISVADNTVLNFGTGQFSIEWFGQLDGWENKGSTLNGIMAKDQLATDPCYGFRLTEGEIASFEVNGILATADAAMTLNTDLHLVGTRDAAGLITLYVNGVAQADTETAAGTVDSATVLYIGRDSVSSRPTDGQALGYGAYNKALSAAEVLTRFNGGAIATLDRWGKKLITAWTNSDFDTFTSSGANITQAVSGGAGDNCYSAIAPLTGSSLRALFTLTMNAGDASDIRFRTASNNGLSADVNGNATLVAGANDIEITAASTDAFAGFLDQIGGATKVDFAVSNFQFIQEGAVLEATSEGISSDQSKWFDNSDNLLTGTISGAEVFNGADSDNLGFILYEFTEVEAINLFWFFQQNQDADTALADIKDGWLPLCDHNDFNIKTYSGNYNFPGTRATDTESGDTNSEKFFGRKPSWTVALQPMSDDTFSNILALADTVEGKLLPFYVRFASESLDSNSVKEDNTVWRVRLAENGIRWTFEFGPDQPWNVTLQLVADIN